MLLEKPVIEQVSLYLTIHTRIFICVEAILAKLITCRQKHVDGSLVPRLSQEPGYEANVDGSYCKDGLQKEAL